MPWVASMVDVFLYVSNVSIIPAELDRSTKKFMAARSPTCLSQAEACLVLADRYHMDGYRFGEKCLGGKSLQIQ